jgi:RND superfamily putative drug exporter
MAFAVAFGVLLDTLLVRSLLVPALAYDLGGRIWWPGGLRDVRRQEDEPRIPESIG